MNIVELNQNEVSVVSGGLSFVDKWNLVGGATACLTVAHLLVSSRAVTTDPSTSGDDPKGMALVKLRFSLALAFVAPRIVLGGLIMGSAYISSVTGYIVGKGVDKLFGLAE